MTMEDCLNLIDDAVSKQRINEYKASRLRECLQAGTLMDVVYSLLSEQIPLKRQGGAAGTGGYRCKLCDEPLKGHICKWCPVCSTQENKVENVNHVHFNCILCFDEGKKKKKLVQVHKSRCPHGERFVCRLFATGVGLYQCVSRGLHTTILFSKLLECTCCDATFVFAV